MVVVSIEKKKNQPEQKLASFSTSARADFSFFLLIHPSCFKLIGVFNRKKEKHPEQELVSFFKIIFNFDWMKNLSQQPEVGSKNRLRFWARGKILIKSKIFRFMYHDHHDNHDHHDHHLMFKNWRFRKGFPPYQENWWFGWSDCFSPLSILTPSRVLKETKRIKRKNCWMQPTWLEKVEL